MRRRDIDISGDGRFVAYTLTNSSGASVQLWDAQLGASTLISGGVSTAHCDFPRLDQSGRYVAFVSDEATNTTNGEFFHIFVRDTGSGGVQMIDATVTNYSSSYFMTPFRLSGSGQCVAVDSPGTELPA